MGTLKSLMSVSYTHLDVYKRQALLVDVDPEVIVKRLTSRRMCLDCNYIGTAADETCPKCGGEMYQRDDDNEATVRNLSLIHI